MRSMDKDGKLQSQLWRQIRQAAMSGSLEGAAVAHLLEQRILSKASFKESISGLLAYKLRCDDLRDQAIAELFEDTLSCGEGLMDAACADLMATHARDPACTSLLQGLLFSKGFQSLVAHRVAHVLWKRGKVNLALLLQSRVAERYCVDIHPAAVIGRGVFIDHAHGLVVGETAVIEDEVSILHEVTLGGTGKERGDRHPKIRRGVLLSAGAKVLGRVEVGEGAKVAACSVVLSDVPPFATVAGIPAKPVGTSQHRLAGEPPTLTPVRSLYETERQRRVEAMRAVVSGEPT